MKNQKEEIEEIQEKLESILIEFSDDPKGIYKMQYKNAVVSEREFTGVGFFTYFVVPDEFVVIDESKDTSLSWLEFEDEPELPADFRILVTDGKLDYIEGYCFSDTWRYGYENAILVSENNNIRTRVKLKDLL
ncbi:MAG: hypothetical protein FWF57_10305 [Defluviitaleaceae bacterium]|nr:hypothetical protein [Defluviitaleaceae bacterium]